MHHLFFDKLDVERSTEFPRHEELTYSPGTAIGNWYEERLHYKTSNFKNSSSFSNDYVPKSVPRDTEFMWAQKLRAEGVDPIIHPRIGCWDYPNFFENFSTTYDLSFNHYPELYKDCGHIERKKKYLELPFEPQEDYIESFDNITGGGLVEQKRQEWWLEKWRPYTTKKTHNQDTFKFPTETDYETKRHATYARNSSKLNPLNHVARYFKLRDGFPFYKVPDCIDTRLVRVPPMSKYNPITWERQKDYSKNSPQ